MFHWATALAYAGLVLLGTHMVGLAVSPEKLRLYSYHKWLGITVLAITLLRALWRAGHEPPPLPASMSSAMQATARWVHLALYALFFAVPFSGWMMSSASGFPVVLFGVLPLPDLVPKDKTLASIFKALHLGLNLGLGSLVFFHVTAALKHQFMDRDGLLARMWPSGGSR